MLNPQSSSYAVALCPSSLPSSSSLSSSLESEGSSSGITTLFRYVICVNCQWCGYRNLLSFKWASDVTGRVFRSVQPTAIGEISLAALPTHSTAVSVMLPLVHSYKDTPSYCLRRDLIRQASTTVRRVDFSSCDTKKMVGLQRVAGMQQVQLCASDRRAL